MLAGGANRNVQLDSDDESQTSSSRERSDLVFLVWVFAVLISNAPDILWDALTGRVPKWLFWCKVAVLIFLLGICLFWQRVRPLLAFSAVMLVFYATFLASTLVGSTSWWKSRFSGPHVSFTVGYIGVYILDLAVALAVIAVLWIIKGDRKKFFLVKGQLDAPIRPVRWLGIGLGNSWRAFGWIFAIAAGLAVLIATVPGLHFSSIILQRAVPILPAGVLFAAINAFNEEIYFRLSLLSTLPAAVGKNHALWINMFLFGLNHYLYGSPPGMIGLLMTGFLAWLLGKSVLETKGLCWAWFMHFVPDVVIFASYAILWVQR